MQRAVSPSLALAAVLMACGSPAWALYKVVGPDGRITYTDRAPSDRPAQALKANGAVASTEGLPYELQRVVSRFPVTLYSSANCTPCDTARQALKTRGVPFSEKTVATADDIQKLAKLENTDQLPVARIGQKQLLGFNQAEWSSYLDAAGYPAKSALPLNYKWPAATPLVPVDIKPVAPQPSGALPRATGGEPTEPSGSAPSGFRF